MRAWLLALLCGVALSAQAQGWVVRIDGAGPLKVGMDFDTVNRVLGERMVRVPPELRASPECFYVIPAAEPRVGLMFVKDVLRRVDVEEPGVLNDRGIGVGDPADKVLRLYGEAVHVTPADYERSERYLSVRSGSGQHGFRFRASAGRVKSYHAGSWDQVEYMEGCL
ncbi:hypothetical protein [Massilia endophytica]|uniref:hypothetical protein n=1 Tax=Massilia endophytica TaxID=2899220 RepID=UPI001E3F8EAD|nr:hypothetical protein [Massilia endophytica]UGQ45310.1 hypothetical protein LSQ66_16135 [Massilia endophytica]